MRLVGTYTEDHRSTMPRSTAMARSRPGNVHQPLSYE
jgi:hypothetical protein